MKMLFLIRSGELLPKGVDCADLCNEAGRDRIAAAMRVRGKTALAEAVESLSLLDSAYPFAWLIKPRLWSVQAVIQHGPTHVALVVSCDGLKAAKELTAIAGQLRMHVAMVAEGSIERTERDLTAQVVALGLEVVERREIRVAVQGQESAPQLQAQPLPTGKPTDEPAPLQPQKSDATPATQIEETAKPPDDKE